MKSLIMLPVIVCLTALNIFAQINEEWAVNYGGENPPTRCYANALDTDENGNIYITGECYINTFEYYYATLKYSPSGELMWKSIYDAGGKTYATGIAVGIDESVYVTGTTFENDQYNIALIKYDSKGNRQWLKIIGNTNFEEMITKGCIITDSNNDVYITYKGQFKDSHSSGYITAKYNSSGNLLWEKKERHGGGDQHPKKIMLHNNEIIVSGTAGKSIYTIKYSNTGSKLWESNYSSEIKFDRYSFKDMVIDSSGNLFSVGSNYGLVNNYNKLFILKQNSNGDIIWSKVHANDSVNTMGLSAAVDNLQRLYVTGQVYSNSNDIKVFIMGFDEQGNLRWEKTPAQTGSSPFYYGSKILYEKDGNLYVSVTIRNPGTDIAVMKLDKNGNNISEITYTEGGAVFVSDMKIDRNMNILIAGQDQNINQTEFVTIKYSQTVGINTISTQVPKGYELHQNYPNPFNPETTIGFEIPKASFVKLSVYDISGRLVETLVSGELNTGVYEYGWSGDKLSSGVYIYRLEAGDFLQTKRMMLVK